MRSFIYFPLLALVFGFAGFSQNAISPEEKQAVSETREFGGFISLQPSALNFQNSKKNNDLQVDNQIFIQQIGQANTIEANTSSGNKDLKLIQYGNRNYISFQSNAEKLQGAIVQKGDNNTSFDFSMNPGQDISTDVLQQGNNLHFERYGSNSIGNDLKFIQTGDTKSIIVRNFK